MASDSTAPAEAGPLSAAFERGRGAGDLPPGLEAVLLALHQRAQAVWQHPRQHVLLGRGGADQRPARRARLEVGGRARLVVRRQAPVEERRRLVVVEAAAVCGLA